MNLFAFFAVFAFCGGRAFLRLFCVFSAVLSLRAIVFLRLLRCVLSVRFASFAVLRFAAGGTEVLAQTTCGPAMRSPASQMLVTAGCLKRQTLFVRIVFFY